MKLAQIAIRVAGVAVIATLVSVPAVAQTASKAVSTPHGAPVVIQNNFSDPVPVNGNVVVSGTVNIANIPSVSVDTTSPLNIKSPRTYSIGVLLDMPVLPIAEGFAVALPAASVLETAYADCSGGVVSLRMIGYATPVAQAVPISRSIVGNPATVVYPPNLSATNYGGLIERKFLFPRDSNGNSQLLDERNINLVFAAGPFEAYFEQQEDHAMTRCTLALTFRELN